MKATRLLFVECKWCPEREVGVDVLTSLESHVNRSGLASKRDWIPCVASAGSFSSKLEDLESQGRVVLLREKHWM